MYLIYIVLLIVGTDSEVQVEENVVITGIRQVLNNDSFEINSPVTIEVRRQAESLLEWCLMDDNKEKLHAFTEQISKDLKGIIVSSATKSFHYNKDKMWGGFFHYVPQRTLINSGVTFWKPAMCQLNQFYINI